MRSFLHVELAYDVAMRCYIPVIHQSYIRSHNTDHKYCLAGCDISSAFFCVGKKSVCKRMIQGVLKFQGLKDLDHGPLTNCQKFTCTQFVGAIYEKLDPTPLHEVSLAKKQQKSYRQITVCIFYILPPTPQNEYG